MRESVDKMSAEEMQAWVERRLDKAAEEIGYAMGLMVVSMFANRPTPEDPEAHLKGFPGIPRLTDLLDARVARIAADGFTEAVRALIPVVRPHGEQD